MSRQTAEDEALRALYGHASEKQSFFFDQTAGSKSDDDANTVRGDFAEFHEPDRAATSDEPRVPATREVFGRWDREDEDDWSEIAFYPQVAERLLKASGFDTSCMRVWKQRGYLKLDGEGKQPKVRIGSTNARMLVVTRAALDAVTDGGTR